MTRQTRLVLVVLLLAMPLVAYGQTPTVTTPEALAALASVEHLPKKGDSGPVVWSTGEYVYDGAGNIAAIGGRKLTYDGQNRLVQFTGTGGLSDQTYSYDVYGNQTSDTLAGTIAVNSGTNRLSGNSATYDEAGNLTQLQPINSASTVQYSYDAFNMIQEVKVGGAVVSRYVYTADDERVRTDQPPSSLTHWTLRDLDGKELRDVQRQGTTWSLVRDYVYRDGRLLVNLTPTGAEYNSLDHLGSPRLVTNQNGQKIGYHEYYPFGVEAFTAGSMAEGSSRHFTGHERDADPTGGNKDVDYMHARFYTATMGRLLSADPVLDTKAAMANAQGWNRYAYVLNNPINHTDPTGKVVELDANADVRKLKVFLTETMRRPTGRADVMAVVNDRNHKLRVTSGRLTSPAQIQMNMRNHSSASITFGTTVPNGNVHLQPNGTGQFVVTGSTMTIDTNAVSRHHADQSGVTTTAHEFDHVNNLRAGGVAQMLQGDVPTSATGPAEQHGQAIAAERPDLTAAQARALVDQLIPVRP
jgi:RHS repeat-associated protein